MIYNYIPVQIGEYYKVTGPSISYQYDVKQYLVLTGVVLPEFFLVDFCNEGDTTTMPMTGTGNTVEIPDACLLTGKRIKAYIVVSGLDAGASETRIEITLPVNRRPARTDITPTPAEQSTIDSLIEAMNTAVEDAGDAKTAAETAQGKAEDAQAAAEAAAAEAEEAVGHYPKIENGTWWVWDAEEEAYVDTGVTAEGQPGQDGFSPIATVTQDGDVTTISITDKDGTTTADIDLGPIKEDVEDLALSKADIIVDTAGPAAIANFPDGADNYPIRQLVATIEPVQDLHGYDYPWPAGGGKNKCDYDTIYSAFKVADNSFSGSSYDIAQLAISIPSSLVGQQITWSAYIDLTEVTTPTSYTAKATVDGVQILGNAVRHGESGYTEVTFTPVSTNDTVQFTWGSGIGTIAVKDFQLEIGSSRTTWSPYSNLCPITGWTGCDVQQRGKNILKLNSSQMIVTGWNVKFPINIKPGTYITSCQRQFGGSENKGAAISLRDENDVSLGTFVGYNFGDTVFSGPSRQVTEEIASKTRYILFSCREAMDSAEAETILNAGIQMELGTTVTEYDQTTGATIPISWEDEAGTVYGGTLVINGDGSVDLIGDKTAVDLGALNYSRVSGQDGTYVFTTAGMSGKALGVTNIISEILATTSVTAWGSSKPDCSICGSATSTTVVIRYDACASVNDLKTALGGYKAAYGLAEPVTYHLASLAELPKVLKGVNNFWVNTGDTSVTYPADTKLYVDKKIAALAAALS